MSLCWTLLDNDDNCFCVIECRWYKTEWLMLVDWSKENTKLDRDPNDWMTETLLNPFVTGRTRSVRSRRDSKSTNRERFDSPAHGKSIKKKRWQSNEANLKKSDRGSKYLCSNAGVACEIGMKCVRISPPYNRRWSRASAWSTWTMRPHRRNHSKSWKSWTVFMAQTIVPWSRLRGRGTGIKRYRETGRGVEGQDKKLRPCSKLRKMAAEDH